MTFCFGMALDEHTETGRTRMLEDLDVYNEICIKEKNRSEKRANPDHDVNEGVKEMV